MAAAGYITEVDYESIWDTEIDTTRFGKINVRIGEQLNFWVGHDASTDFTDVRILPILEQLSEEILNDIIATAKLNAVTNPWDFIQASVARVSTRILANYDALLTEIRTTLGKQYHYTESATLIFPSDYTSLLKRTT